MKAVFLYLLISVLSVITTGVYSQDLNSINGSGFNILTGAAPTNAPENMVVMGLQMHYDTNYKWQLINAFYSDNYYLRRYNYGWSDYYKIWHSGNFNPANYLSKPVVSIGDAGSSDTFKNGYTFSYAISGSPWNGAFISFGGFNNNYDTQFSTDYGPQGGKHISFRTRNGDAQVWNPWYELWNSGNLNGPGFDFTARTIQSANVYNNGNLWSKEIRVALSKP